MHATEGPNIASLTWHMIPVSQTFSFILLFQSFDIFWSNLETLRVLAQKTESLQEIYLLCLPVPTCRLLLLPPRRMVIERLIVLDHGIWSWLNDSLRNGWCLKPIEKDVWFHMIVRQCHGEKHDQHVIWCGMVFSESIDVKGHTHTFPYIHGFSFHTLFIFDHLDCAVSILLSPLPGWGCPNSPQWGRLLVCLRELRIRNCGQGTVMSHECRAGGYFRSWPKLCSNPRSRILTMPLVLHGFALWSLACFHGQCV